MELLKNYNCIGASLNGLIQEVKSKGNNPIKFPKKSLHKYKDRTSDWVGHSDLKQLDTNELFVRKYMIEDMEAELTEAPK